MIYRRKNSSFEDTFDTEQNNWPIVQTNTSSKQLKKEKKAARKNRKNKKHENHNSIVLTEPDSRADENNDNVLKSGTYLLLSILISMICSLLFSMP